MKSDKLVRLSDVIAFVNDERNQFDLEYEPYLEEFRQRLETLPAADRQEVVKPGKEISRTMKIKCDVCGTNVPAISTGVCINQELSKADILWDYTNCPNCKCQILLKQRYRDINDPYFSMMMVYNPYDGLAEKERDSDRDG